MRLAGPQAAYIPGQYSRQNSKKKKKVCLLLGLFTLRLACYFCLTCCTCCERPPNQGTCKAQALARQPTLQRRNIHHWNILPISPPPLAVASLVLILKAEVSLETAFEAKLQQLQTSLPIKIARLKLRHSEFGCRKITKIKYRQRKRTVAREVACPC